MPHGLLDILAGNRMQAPTIPGLPDFRQARQPMPVMPADVAPVGIPRPAPQEEPSLGSRFTGFLGSDAGKGLLYGIGSGLLAKMNDRTNPIVPTAIEGMQTFKKKAALETLAKQVASGGMSPQQRAIAEYAFSTGDPEMMKLVTTSLFATKKWGKPIAVIDPVTGQQKYIQLDEAGNQRDVEGATPPAKGNGITVYDPATGAPMVVVGGSGQVIGQGAQPGQPGQATLVGDQTKSGRTGQGGVFTNTATGEKITTNTPAMQTRDQKTLAAVERVKPQIQTIIDTLPQFQSYWKGKLAAVEGGINKYIPGANLALPSQQAEAESALATAPESLLNAYGLNTTDKALDMMKAAVKPRDGESPDGYKARLVKKLDEISGMGDQTAYRVAHGTTIQPGVSTGEEPIYTDEQLDAYAADAISRATSQDQVEAINQELAIQKAMNANRRQG